MKTILRLLAALTLTIAAQAAAPLVTTGVVNEQFADGNSSLFTRAANGTFTSLEWFFRNSSVITTNTTGMTLSSSGLSGQSAGAQFPSTPLTLVTGATLTLSFDFTPTITATAANSFQFGLYNTRGDTANNTFTSNGMFSATFTHAGYKTSIVLGDTATAQTSSLAKRTLGAGALLHGTNNSELTNRSDSLVFPVDTTYNAVFSITKISPTQHDLTVTISGPGISTPITLSASDNSATADYATFDSIAFYAQRNAFHPLLSNITLTHTTPLLFITQPQSQSIDEPNSLTLTATLSTPALACQWSKDGNPIPNATNSTLTIPVTTTADAGNYTLTVTATDGTSITSDPAIITINPLPAAPLIIEQPSPVQILTPGKTLSLTTTAAGGTLTYQWKKDNANIPGATSATLTIPNLTTADTGDYTCDVTNAHGTTTTATARVTVRDAITQTILLVDEQFTDGTRTTLTQNETGTFTSLNWICRIPAYVTTSPNGATLIANNDITQSTQQSLIAQLPASLTLAPTGNIALTVSFTPTRAPSAETTSFQFGLFNTRGLPENKLINDGTAFGSYSMPGYKTRINPNTTVYIDTRNDTAGGLFNSTTLYTALANGSSTTALAANFTYTNTLLYAIDAAGNTTLTNTLNSSGTSTNSTFSVNDPNPHAPTIDTIAFYSRISSGDPRITRVQLLLTTPVEILTQPTPQTLDEQQPLTLMTLVSGALLNYQWFHNNNEIPGATTNTLTIAKTTPADTGNYTCQITLPNNTGTLTTNPALVTINPLDGAPAIITHPASQTVLPGNTLTLTAAATGASLSYQWLKDGVAIPGATNSTLIITGTTTDTAGNFTCQISNTNGTSTTNPATITTTITPTLNPYFRNDSILQRNQPIPVWGTGNPTDTITLTFANKTYTANPDSSGKWLILLDAQPANTTPQTLTFNANNGTSTTLSNILVGDLWLAAGQSNMALTLKNIVDASATNPTPEQQAAATAAIANAPTATPYIRAYLASTNYDIATPRDTNVGSWHLPSAGTFGNTSALAYYFAKHLAETTHQQIPIGILNVNWGATTLETWAPREFFTANPEFASLLPENSTAAVTKETATGCYNYMIHPIRQTTLAGILWYQGEANDTRYDEYSRLFPAFIEYWRNTTFNNPDLPFYFVQLSAYSTLASWPEQRIAQSAALLLDNTAMVVSIDTPAPDNSIHPADKQTPGFRLALHALAHTYGTSTLQPDGPEITAATFTPDGTVTLTFTNASDLHLDDTKLRENIPAFQIANANGIYQPATTGTITQLTPTTATLTLTSTVTAPAFVRYAWHSTPSTPLYATNTHPLTSQTYTLPSAPFQAPLSLAPENPPLNPATLTPDQLLLYALTTGNHTDASTLPNTGTTTHLPITTITNNTLSLTFTPTRQNLTYEIQQSTDLQSWLTIQTLQPSEITNTPISINSTSNTTTTPTQFLRLKVSPPQP